ARPPLPRPGQSPSPSPTASRSPNRGTPRSAKAVPRLPRTTPRTTAAWRLARLRRSASSQAGMEPTRCRPSAAPFPADRPSVAPPTRPLAGRDTAPGQRPGSDQAWRLEVVLVDVRGVEHGRVAEGDHAAGADGVLAHVAGLEGLPLR